MRIFTLNKFGITPNISPRHTCGCGEGQDDRPQQRLLSRVPRTHIERVATTAGNLATKRSVEDTDNQFVTSPNKGDILARSSRSILMLTAAEAV
jgi:hypothetical protein